MNSNKNECCHASTPTQKIKKQTHTRLYSSTPSLTNEQHMNVFSSLGLKTSGAAEAHSSWHDSDSHMLLHSPLYRDGGGGGHSTSFTLATQ